MKALTEFLGVYGIVTGSAHGRLRWVTHLDIDDEAIEVGPPGVQGILRAVGPRDSAFPQTRIGTTADGEGECHETGDREQQSPLIVIAEGSSDVREVSVDDLGVVIGKQGRQFVPPRLELIWAQPLPPGDFAQHLQRSRAAIGPCGVAGKLLVSDVRGASS